MSVRCGDLKRLSGPELMGGAAGSGLFGATIRSAAERLVAALLGNIFYDSETQAPQFFFLSFIFSSGRLGFMNQPSIRAIMRIITFDLGS